MRCVLDTDEGRFGGHMRHNLGKTVFHHPKEWWGSFTEELFLFSSILMYPSDFFLGWCGGGGTSEISWCCRGLDYGHGNPFPSMGGIDRRPHSVKLLNFIFLKNHFGWDSFVGWFDAARISYINWLGLKQVVVFLKFHDTLEDEECFDENLCFRDCRGSTCQLARLKSYAGDRVSAMASQPIELFDQFRVWMVEIWVGKNQKLLVKPAGKACFKGESMSMCGSSIGGGGIWIWRLGGGGKEPISWQEPSLSKASATFPRFVFSVGWDI